MSYTKEIQKKIDENRQLLNELDEINDFQFKHYVEQKEILEKLSDNTEAMKDLLEKRKLAIEYKSPLSTL